MYNGCTTPNKGPTVHFIPDNNPAKQQHVLTKPHQKLFPATTPPLETPVNDINKTDKQDKPSVSSQEKTHSVYSTYISMYGKTYSEQTGAFTVTSTIGNR